MGGKVIWPIRNINSHLAWMSLKVPIWSQSFHIWSQQYMPFSPYIHLSAFLLQPFHLQFPWHTFSLVFRMDSVSLFSCLICRAWKDNFVFVIRCNGIDERLVSDFSYKSEVSPDRTSLACLKTEKRNNYKSTIFNLFVW